MRTPQSAIDNWPGVTDQRIRAAIARLREIVRLHRGVEAGFIPGTRAMWFTCAKCKDARHPCATLKLAARALDALGAGEDEE